MHSGYEKILQRAMVEDSYASLRRERDAGAILYNKVRQSSIMYACL